MIITILTEFTVQSIVTICTFTKITIQQRQADATIMARIFVLRTRKTVVNFRIVLSDVHRKILVRFSIYH